jgi:hypothetical protein
MHLKGLIGLDFYLTYGLFCRIFEHFAIQPYPVTEFLKLRSALHSNTLLWRADLIFEHFAIQPDPVTEFLKLKSALHSKRLAEEG